MDDSPKLNQGRIEDKEESTKIAKLKLENKELEKKVEIEQGKSTRPSNVWTANPIQEPQVLPSQPPAPFLSHEQPRSASFSNPTSFQNGSFFSPTVNTNPISPTRHSIPALYQHTSRFSPINFQHPVAIQAAIPETSDPFVSSPASAQIAASNGKARRKKRASTQPSQFNAVGYNDQSDEENQDKLTAFASNSPIKKVASVSTINSRFIEKDRLTCIHNLGILDGIDCNSFRFIHYFIHFY